MTENRELLCGHAKNQALLKWLVEKVQSIKDRSSSDEWAYVYADIILDRLAEELKSYEPRGSQSSP